MTRRAALALFVAIALAAAQGAGAATFVVDSNADPGDGSCATAGCTLREAIAAANATLGADLIQFALPAAPATILVTAGGLPVVSEAVTLDGASQAGFAGEPLVILDGSGAGAVAGLRIEASGVVVLNLAIRSFAAAGVAVASGSGNRIADCRFTNNGGLPIDLGADGPSANDAGDADAGANGLQNAPQITAVGSSAGTISVAGILESAPSSAYAVEIFAGCVSAALAPVATARIGSAPVTTNASGLGSFSFSGPGTLGGGVTGGVTATATDGAGSTSEMAPIVPFTGDLDRSGTLSAVDLVVLAGYLVGNIAPGSAPFLAPAAAADLNGTGSSNSADLVILANFLVGNGGCLPLPAPPNQLPVAVATVTPQSGDAGTSFEFSAAGSFDPDGSIDAYAWSFGDTGTATGASVAHTYAPGSYTATLTVTDDRGGIDTATVDVVVAPENFFISITNFAFVPANPTVTVGTRLVWTNFDSSPHTVTGLPFDSPTLGQGESYVYVTSAADAGTIGYNCGFHPAMTGSVTVQ